MRQGRRRRHTPGPPGSINWITTDLVYKKDFINTYLLARALAAKDSPHRPMNEMARQYIGHVQGQVSSIPTPHPPTFGLMVLWIASLSYPTAAAAWSAVTILLVMVSVLRRMLPLGASKARSPVLVLVLFARADHAPPRLIGAAATVMIQGGEDR